MISDASTEQSHNLGAMPSVASRAGVVPVGQLRISAALRRTIDAQQTTGLRVVEFDLDLLPLDKRHCVDGQSGPIAQSRYT